MATQSVYSCLQSLLFAFTKEQLWIWLSLSFYLYTPDWKHRLHSQCSVCCHCFFHLFARYTNLGCLFRSQTHTQTHTHTQTQTRSRVAHNNAVSLHYHCQGLARSSNILMARVMKLASFEPFFTHFTPHICWSFNIVIICYTTKCKFMLVIL